MLKLAWKYMRYYKSQTFAIFASILLTASLLSGISSLIYSSQKSDLANSKTIYGDWHYYIETDKELFNSVESGEKGKGYTLEQCGKMEIRDVVAEEFMICFIHADETYRQMAHRDLLEGTFPEKENEIAADGFVLSNLGFSGNLGDSLRIGEKEYIVMADNGYITLTESGQKRAQSVLERHTILSDWLISIGVSKATALEDACRVEHDLSEESFNAIKHTYKNADNQRD